MSIPRRPLSVVLFAPLGALLLFAAGACGGKVVFADGGGGNGGTGGSGSTGGAECVVSACNGLCTKCVGQKCFTGKCDQAGICQPPDVTFTCGK